MLLYKIVGTQFFASVNVRSYNDRKESDTINCVPIISGGLKARPRFY